MEKQYEYKVLQRTTLDGAQDMLNMYGKDGWDLVGYSSDVVHINSAIRTYQFILKKEKK